MTMAPLIDVFRLREKLEIVEGRLRSARAKVQRLRTSPQAPTDPTALRKAVAAVATAERAYSVARLDLLRFDALP